MGSNHQKGTIQWFLSQVPATAEQPDPNKRPIKQQRLTPVQQQHPCDPQLTLRSANQCQQLLAQQLGWRCPPSLNTWHQAQQHHLSCICLRAVPTQSGFRVGAKTSPISCLEIQNLPDSSSNSCSSGALVALGDAYGRLHICKLSRLQAASASALNAAAALPADVREALLDPTRWARRAMAAEGVPEGAGNIPTAAAQCAGGTGVLTFDTQQQLRSCCWLQQQHNGSTAASSSEGVLVTSGPGGLFKRVIAEGRHATSSLRAKGGSVVEAAGTVVSLDAQAAYQLCAVSGKSLLLWDLRAGPAAAATLPLQAPPTVLRAMPGGQVLLSAAADGQVCLYDVRRINNSSIVNFGSSRGNQQLLLTHNLKARAQAAGLSSGGCSVSYGVAHDPQFLCDAVLNPVDPNLLAYIRPNLQAGLFDLFSGQVLQQVSLLECQDPPSIIAGQVPTIDSSLLTAAGGQGCWDSSGRVLYTQGLFQYWQQQGAGSDIVITVEVSPTLVAVDFGSWHGRKQRWGTSSSSGGGSNGSSQGGGELNSQASGGGGEQADVQAGGAAGDSQSSGSSRQHQWQGRKHLSQGGQVLHRELHWTAAATAVAAAGSCGEMIVGTQSGDLLWLG